MALLKSTAFLNAVTSRTSARTAIGNNKTILYSGTMPTDKDAAVSTGALCILTKNGAAATTNTVQPVWTLVVDTCSSGTLTLLELQGAGTGTGLPLVSAMTAGATPAATANLIVAAINGTLEIPDFTAAIGVTSATVLITGPIGCGTALNAMKLIATVTGGDLAITATAATTTAGVAAPAGACNYDFSPTAGVITSSETWSGVSTAVGTATFFIRTTDLTDTGSVGTSGTLVRRFIGSVGLTGSSADMMLSSTTLIVGTPISITGSTLTVA
ncbi:hypothetical protein UFOVP1138_36 [uncultured Caudovirales phage]|uniref:Uncharacterized protein n=1 Tax=uncultured Caudovirales phage TaxID=2100421 RepID=A0A6J5QXY9_9CAUD|nr:hypothetical protein UFOVP975_85 [uncultured Caudovirales phage]CAB4186241.1 hypothetical protein UFOVP1138_36 [uncultured Caudovirales phage]CAB4204413.1 hypothetical protein UFOVP1394_33 [uncultured Caudovirales phage]